MRTFNAGFLRWGIWASLFFAGSWILFSPSTAFSAGSTFCSRSIASYSPHLIIDPPEGTPVVGEYIYFTGFADSPFNYRRQFTALSQQGIRVLSVAYPSHAGATGFPLGILSFETVAQGMVDFLGRHGRANLPLFIGGWSTGGTVSEYLVQHDLIKKQLRRTISGVIEIAPGMPVKMIPGSFGFVTKATLTPDPVGEFWEQLQISPRTPFFHPVFAITLRNASWDLYHHPERHGRVPTLLFTAGEFDHYVDGKMVLDWGKTVNNHAAYPPDLIQPGRLWIESYPKEFHALHWGAHLQAIEAKTARFIQAVLKQQSGENSLDVLMGPPGISQY